jgi:miniconductance mechanosensitive channel
MPASFSSLRTFAELQRGFHDWLLSQRLTADVAVLLAALAGVVAMLVLAFIVQALTHLLLGKLLPGIVNRLDTDRPARWEAALRKHTLASRSAHIVATLVVYRMTPQMLTAYPSVVVVVRNLIEGYVVLIVLLAINAMLQAAAEVFRQDGRSSRLPVQFMAQAAQTVVWLVGGIIIVSVVFDESVTVLLTSMAGMTALLMLVFRDSLLGYVAGIQIVNNDLVKEGDWIEAPKFETNGAVIDIGLITVKVRNWDKTISSVPSYSLISDGFKNWRGMYDSGGRRITRAVPIDMSGIGFCNAEMLERLRQIAILREYLERKQEEIEAFNREHSVGEPEPANNRRLTNIGTYRAYLQCYLEHHPDIRNDMTLMVRQLAPGPEGVPIEIYAFCANQKWTEYESIQADIIDHALSVLPMFGLSAYQYPSSGALHVPDAGH